MSIENCPNDTALRAFAVGDVGESDLDVIASHVSQCPRCDTVLQDLDKYADGLVTELYGLNLNDAKGGRTEVPGQLLEVARSTRQQGSSESQSDVALDPGRRLARKLAEGPCRLGRFELEAELGVGAFGYVFRARDTELDRTVAMKVQRAGSFASDEEVERFLREARSVAQLKHPAIVALHDTGRSDDDVCYLVTEYVEGETLEESLENSRFEQQVAAKLVAEIAEALQYAHEHGVIHRDVKPSNILIDHDVRPHIMDFGLAKRDVGDTMTSDGRVMGTPAYMSPEQARGQSHQVDARGDIYSLGVVLYEMLTGERPFQGNRRMLLLQVLQDEPRPPRQLNEQIPRDLQTICLKAIAKSPSRRYQSAGEFAEDLRRWLRDEPIKARPMGRTERLWRWCRINPLAASLLLAVTLGSTVGFLYLSYLSKYFVRETALASVRMEADMLETINAYYSEEVVDGLDRKQLKVAVSHDYLSRRDALPLPVVFTKDAGKRISEGQSGMQVQLYSDFPWRDQDLSKDAFQRRALASLNGVLNSGGTDLSYHEFTERGGEPVVRYARAQVMKDSCVTCHNESKESPKRDWKPGELAGVLEITRPLEQDIQRTRTGLRGTFVLMSSVAVMLVGVSFALLLGTRRRKGVKY